MEEPVDGEAMFVCGPCGRTVPQGNRVMHSLVCGRHITITTPSSGSGTEGGRDISEEEIDERTIIIPTVSDIEGGTDIIQPDSSSADADADLRALMVECEFCRLEVRATMLDEHSNNCGTRTDVCERCMNYVRLRDLERHLDSACNYGVTGSAMPAALGHEYHHRHATLLPPPQHNPRRRRNNNSNNSNSTPRQPQPQRQQSFLQDDAATWATVGIAVGAVAVAAMSLMNQR